MSFDVIFYLHDLNLIMRSTLKLIEVIESQLFESNTCRVNNVCKRLPNWG